MVKIRRVDRALIDRPQRSTVRKTLTPREREERMYARLIRKLAGPDDVFEVALGPTDKPATVRQRLLRTASGLGVEVAVRKHAKGFVVGLMTPERRTRRGRPRASA
ncbi:MAG TPA: hypothetical protein VMH24_08575 [Candidatus Sulfotelmatobacter sp.]|nr:hypothetical protein [Candidatus Sulfotelmatobacter sp.]